MQPVTASVTIDRPREELYALLADLRAHEQFTDHFLAGFTGDAQRVRVRAKLPGPKQWSEIAAVEQVAPSLLRERGTGGAGRRVTEGTYRLEPAAGGTATHVTFEFAILRLPTAEKPMLPFLRRYFRKQNARALERLKALAESRGAVATAA
jgi:hypothetical protein